MLLLFDDYKINSFILHLHRGLFYSYTWKGDGRSSNRLRNLSTSDPFFISMQGKTFHECKISKLFSTSKYTFSGEMVCFI